MSAIIDKKFKNTPIEGQWPKIKSFAQKRNVDPVFMAGIIAHETWNGANVRYNNPGGIMDWDNQWKTKRQFNTLDEGLDYMARNIARRSKESNGSLNDFARIYAPPGGVANDPHGLNQYWFSGVQGHMRDFGRP